MLTQDELAALLPHAGDMVLLDRVTAWDDSSIACGTASHRSPDNPLRRDGIVSSLCGVEYGAQAMALHGALTTDRTRRSGVLASLKAVTLHASRLDDVDGELTVTAECLLRRRDSFIYRFSLQGAGIFLLEGQASVFLT